MPRHFFPFLISLVLTLIAGFFVWKTGVIDKINFNFYPASIQNSQVENKVKNPQPLPQDEQKEEQTKNHTAPKLAVVLSEEEKQDILDDIAEKLDIIQQQVNELSHKNDNNDQKDDKKKDDDKKDEQDKDQKIGDKIEKNDEVTVCTGQININNASQEDLDKLTGVGPVIAQKIIDARPFYSLNDLLKVSGIGETTLQKIMEQGCAYTENTAGGGSGGGGTPSYPKILISEVQILPKESRFVELFNPNSNDVDLTNWYLQRKDSNDASWGSFVSHTDFAGKIIPEGGYFLISNLANSDILADLTLTDDNALALKNPNGDISDKLGYGNALDFELAATTSLGSGQSIGRKVLANGTEQDADNNSADFEIQTPTPKSQNITYAAPPILPPTSEQKPTLPTGTITINNGAIYTNNRNVTLNISAPPDVVQMRIANGSSYHDWELYQNSKIWQLPTTNGLKTVRVKFRDSAGNETATGIPATIILDTTPPIITLNGPALVNLNVGDNYQELGATVTDNLDPGVLISIGGDLVDTTSPATFHITYDAIDSALNHSIQVIRTIIVSAL